MKPPLGFVRDCRLTKTGFGLLGAVLGLEVITGVVAVLGAWVAFVVRRERRGRLFGNIEREEVVVKG